MTQGVILGCGLGCGGLAALLVVVVLAGGRPLVQSFAEMLPRKPTKRPWQSSSEVGPPAAAARPPSAPGLTMANYERITEGMSRAEVDAILGRGSEQASASAPGLLGNTEVKVVTWQAGMKNVSVTFVGDEVQTKVQVGLGGCLICGGSGVLDCPVCVDGRAQGRRCPVCEGRGSSTCTICNGKG